MNCTSCDLKIEHCSDKSMLEEEQGDGCVAAL